MIEIKQNLVPASKYPLKSPYTMAPIGICVHNTANDASAKNEVSYMIGNALQTGFHIAVDDVEAVQGIPLNRTAWHAGDDKGQGNMKYIGIEICYSKSGGSKFTKAEENASELIAQLLKERNWGIDKVKKHQDFSGKYCPARTLDLGWDRFLTMIKNKLSGGSMANMYKGYDLENAESMKVAVDILVRVQAGEFIDKPTHVQKMGEEYARGLRDGAKPSASTPAVPSTGDAPNAPVNGDPNDPNSPNWNGNPDPTRYEENGLSVMVQGQTTLKTYNFKLKNT